MRTSVPSSLEREGLTSGRVAQVRPGPGRGPRPPELCAEAWRLTGHSGAEHQPHPVTTSGSRGKLRLLE